MTTAKGWFLSAAENQEQAINLLRKFLCQIFAPQNLSSLARPALRLDRGFRGSQTTYFFSPQNFT